MQNNNLYTVFYCLYINLRYVVRCAGMTKFATFITPYSSVILHAMKILSSLFFVQKFISSRYF